MQNLPNLPKAWEFRTLGDCLDYEQPQKYIVNSTKYNDSYKIPVLTAGKGFILGYTNETQGIFTKTPVIIFDDFTTDTKFVDFPFKVKSSAMKILHPKSNADIKFMYYLMQSITIRHDTHKRYWISIYAKVKIPLPPIDEQKRIVKIIDEKFAKIDKGLDLLLENKELLRKYKLSLLKSAFDGKLVSNSKNWEIKTLGEVCDILDNMRKPINAAERKQRLENTNSKYAYYGATGQVGYIDDYLCDFEAILLGEDGAPFLEPFKDKAYIVSGKYWVNNHAHILKAKENFADNKFICFFLNNLDYKPYVYGTTRLKLNQSSMKQIQIPLPPLKTQKEIVSILDTKFKVAEALEKLNDENIQNFKLLKKAILKDAFKGGLKG